MADDANVPHAGKWRRRDEQCAPSAPGISIVVHTNDAALLGLVLGQMVRIERA